MIETTSKRRWLPRFGLRTLMIAVAVICVLLGSAILWYHSQVAEWQRHLNIAKNIDSYNGGAILKSESPFWWSGNGQMFQRIDDTSFLSDECNAVAVANELAQVDTLESIEIYERYLDDKQFLDRLTKLQSLKQVSVWIDCGPDMATPEQRAQIYRKVNANIQVRIAQVNQCVPKARVIPQGLPADFYHLRPE